MTDPEYARQAALQALEAIDLPALTKIAKHLIRSSHIWTLRDKEALKDAIADIEAAIGFLKGEL